jgi:metal-responsive CopG/Arc/MetJ family transcriptional regulator
MNFSVHLDDRTMAALEDLARTSRKTRNALIRQAVTELLERQRHGEWPASVLEFFASPTDNSDLVPFEARRDELVPPEESRL